MASNIPRNSVSDRVNIEDEIKKSYLDYAMSVIVGRALPDIRDGLKPVHRRILYAMRQLGNEWNKSHKKSARIVGDVIGKYHPHGDSAVYDAIVRMAQPFSMRYLLVDGQGNFGSVDGDSPAAMRYTEIRMSQLASDLLADINLNTVDYVANYDGTETMPEVLPTRIPNLLVNGSAGIAVGMATNIPPHNLAETCAACLAVQRSPDISLDELMELLPGPDFPTAGLINGRAGIVKAYRTGRGSLTIRGKAEIGAGSRSGFEQIVITELPYMVNKARLVEKIALLAKDKQIEGISELRDESDKDGIRIVLELRRAVQAEILLNNLYNKSQLQVSFGINMVALVGGQPKQMNIMQVLNAFLSHRREVVTRRSLFLLQKARTRAHLLEGLAIALTNIDEVVALIRSTASPADAKARLIAHDWQSDDFVMEILSRAGAENCRPKNLDRRYGLQAIGENDSAARPLYRLSPEQAQAILDLRLHRLTGLEQRAIKDEYTVKIKEIEEYIQILSDPDRLQKVIEEELIEVQQKYSDKRRTVIMESEQDLMDEDLITDELRVITLTRDGYVVASSLHQYRIQHRGGVGRSATSVKTNDTIISMVVARSHDTLLCFSNLGRVYRLRAFHIHNSGYRARGRPLVNLIALAEDEKIIHIISLRSFPEDHYILTASNKGKVKRTSLSAFANIRRNGIRALTLVSGQRLISVEQLTKDDEVMLFSSDGRGIRFAAGEIRPTGRVAAGVAGMRTGEGNDIVSMVIPAANTNTTVLCFTSNGYGKRTPIDHFRLSHRSGLGVRAIKCNEQIGQLLGAIQVHEDDELILITDQGTLIRLSVSEIPVLGRNTQGVRLVRLRQGERLVDLVRLDNSLLEQYPELNIQEETEDTAIDSDDSDDK